MNWGGIGGFGLLVLLWITIWMLWVWGMGR